MSTTASHTDPPPLQRAMAAMAETGVDAALVGPGADLRYLSGYEVHESERLTLLVARADGGHTLVLPTLERPRAEATDLPAGIALADWGETGDPIEIVVSALSGLGPRPRLSVGDRLWATFVLALQERLPEARWERASGVTGPLRMRKTAAELDALQRAAAAIDRAHQAVGEVLRPGRTEEEVARDIADLVLSAGHDEVSFVIVASGPNGASPHHEPSGRELQPEDAVVVDIGGAVDGYSSDCTRNYVLERPPDDFAAIHRVLEEAHTAACEAVRPGAAAGSVDAAARDVIASAGYGEFFVHRTGHGIGLEVHEEPYIVAGNPLPLEPGMVFSVEPGIYLPGRFGMRIEDIVVVTDDGGQRLNHLDREPVVVAHAG